MKKSDKIFVSGWTSKKLPKVDLEQAEVDQDKNVKKLQYDDNASYNMFEPDDHGDDYDDDPYVWYKNIFYFLIIIFAFVSNYFDEHLECRTIQYDSLAKCLKNNSRKNCLQINNNKWQAEKCSKRYGFGRSSGHYLGG